uniref:Uncharacterized protein n=1 Tax=Ciona intestinalis TaxID=7719 RepID=H2XZR2_CIOIN
MSGTTAGLTTVAPPPTNILVIVLPIVGGVVLIAAIIITICCVQKVKRKRAFEGKYSPSANEEKGGVRMNDMVNVMQPPPPERLI